MSKVLSVSIPFIFLGSCVAWFSLWLRDARRPPEIAEGVNRVDWLPVEATNINYYRSYGFTAYEFQISEPGFRAWAANAARKPGSEYVFYRPVTDVADLEESHFFPIIQRYNYFLDRHEYSPEDSGAADLHKGASIEITNGLWGEMRRGSASGYSIGYDRETGTAYWQTNPR